MTILFIEQSHFTDMEEFTRKLTKDELKLKILAAYSDEEWEMLRQDDFPVPASAFNRKTLLRLLEAIPDPDAEIPEDAVSKMRGS